MLSNSELSSLIALIYEAAVDPQKWKAFLESGSKVFRSHIATLHFQNTLSTETGFNICYEMEDSRIADYIEHFGALSPYTRRSEVQQEGRAFVRRDLVDSSALLTTEFYNDWAGPQGLFDFIAGTIFRRGPVAGNVTFWRPETSSPFHAEDVQTLQILMPHMVRAMEIHSRMASAERSCSALESALDLFGRPLFLFKADGKLLRMNSKAHALIAAKNGLALRNGHLEAGRLSETASLRLAFQAALACARGKLAPVPGLVTVSRASGRRPLLLWIAPLAAGMFPDEQDTLIGVVAIDPDAVPANPHHVLKEVLGLTAAEIRLANALLSGDDLTEAADRFGVSRNTVRSQLQSIFGKTGTSRQGELVRLLTQLTM